MVTSQQIQRPSQAPPIRSDHKLPLNLSGDHASVSGGNSRPKEINIVPVTGDSVKVIASSDIFKTSYDRFPTFFWYDYVALNHISFK